MKRSDFPAYYTWYCDPRVQEPLANASWNPNVSPESYFETEFSTYLSRKPGNQIFTVVDEGDVPIGMVNFFNFSDDEHSCEVGIAIGEVRRWGQGHGSEALQLLLEYLDRRFRLKSVVARILASNKRSLRLFSQAGFQFETEVIERESTFHRYRHWFERVDSGLG